MLDIVGNAYGFRSGAVDIIGRDADVLLSGDEGVVQAHFQGRPAAFAQALQRIASISRMPVPPALSGVMTRPVLAPQTALDAAVSANMPAVIQDKPIANAVEIPFGFGPTTVAGGASTTFNLQPAAYFKGDRLSIPQQFATSFSMTAFLIGQMSMLLNGNEVPCESFSDLSYNPRGWKLPTIQVGQPAVLTFRNRTTTSQIIAGTLWGFAAF